jgi:hypothetical protein
MAAYANRIVIAFTSIAKMKLGEDTQQHYLIHVDAIEATPAVVPAICDKVKG